MLYLDHLIARTDQRSIQRFELGEVQLMERQLADPMEDPSIAIFKISRDFSPNLIIHQQLMIDLSSSVPIEKESIISESPHTSTRPRKLGEVLVYQSPRASHAILRVINHQKNERPYFYRDSLICLSPSILVEYLDLIAA